VTGIVEPGPALEPARRDVDDDAAVRCHGRDEALSMAHVTSAIVPCPQAVE
jgi:hypothetical protein